MNNTVSLSLCLVQASLGVSLRICKFFCRFFWAAGRRVSESTSSHLYVYHLLILVHALTVIS